jgi:hypothetical protein
MSIHKGSCSDRRKIENMHSSIYLHKRQVLVSSFAGWLVDHLVLRNFGPYGVIFMNVCVVINVAVVMLLRDSGLHGTIFMTMCVYYFRFSRHS